MHCPKCGSTKIVKKGCCGNKRYICSKCKFNGPRRIFIDGLPSSKKG